MGAATVALGTASALPPGAVPRYTRAMLHEAVFEEQARTTVRTQAAGAPREEVIDRTARWEIRVGADSLPLPIEGWYAALDLWREDATGRRVPDTDGLVGGRFRGRLDGDGLVALLGRPFIPDEVAAVSDLREALATLLPRLPRTALAPGGRWADSTGWFVVRLEDSAASGTALARYRWSHQRADTTRAVEADSLPYTVRTTIREQGQFSWHPTLGPLAWRRSAVIEVEIPADGPVRRPVRTRLEERVEARRRPARP